LELYNINNMAYGARGLDGSLIELTTMEKAKDIMSLLESDDALMSDFNFLLRQKKLKQLKNR